MDALLSMGVLRDYSDLESEGGAGVIFIPALSGLQVPRIPGAKGVIAGLTLNSDRGAVVAGLRKSIAFHVRFVIAQAAEKVSILRADGGLSRSGSLLREISAATELPVERRADLEATSRGLAMLQMASTSGRSLQELAKVESETEVFSAKKGASTEEEYAKWMRLTGLLRSSKGSYLAE